MTLSWGLFVGLAVKSCDQIWLPCLMLSDLLTARRIATLLVIFVHCPNATCRRGRASDKQRLTNQSIPLPLCPQRQVADIWILFNLEAMPLDDKAKATWPLKAATLKWQAVIMRHSGKLVWNQHEEGGAVGSKCSHCPGHKMQSLSWVLSALIQLVVQKRTPSCFQSYREEK